MASLHNMLPEKQFQCTICQQVFTDPVTTPCGHNFCRSCIQSVWDSSDVCSCPTCGKTFTPRPEMSINTAFKELAESFRKARCCSSALKVSVAQPGEVVCDVCAATSLQVKALKSCLVCLTSYCDAHLEPHQRVSTLKLHKLIEPVKNLQDRMCKKHERLLEMFCRDEQKCVCQFCTETEHKDHQAVTIEDESAERKVQIKKTEADFQQMIQDRQKKVEEIKSCLKLSTVSAEREMKDSDRLFASLIRFMEERRAEVNTDIREKQKAAELRAGELIEDLQQEITQLQARNTELEELRSTDDHFHLLQRLPSLTSPPPSREWLEIGVHPELCVGTVRRALSEVETALQNELDGLKKEEMKRMQKYAAEVVLDPDTAHPNLVLSADGKQVGRGELLHIVPDNPQRFDPVICVLGKRGYLSGRFYFQVAVGKKTFWDLGMVKESVNRKGMITSKPENGYWTVRLRNGNEYRALDSPSILLSVAEKPRTVGVFTDYEEGTVSFFNVENRSHIYTFTGCLFADRIFPFFSPGVCDEGKNTAPLVITAVNHEMPISQNKTISPDVKNFTSDQVLN
ncbi:E3 ubiquitin-protein ligase TRIM39-like [Echeneis naucrates]|uniref:E3 ubiquitin-protein ligase TRIM39-like n=1 Tax=Echeneis naucrates TaxID=173247 RepID=A0A665V779_ECHNA|nr:E3 ubiquitin-protein ligase TRIM39-like [Echeneis naucrates]XP_029382289.1 E3 ubiquitin-protein ligase TRIM39-like [Echeneis naucrates]